MYSVHREISFFRLFLFENVYICLCKCVLCMYKSILVLKLLNQDSRVTKYFLFIFPRYQRHLCIRRCQTCTSGRNIYIANRSVSELVSVTLFCFIFWMEILSGFWNRWRFIEVSLLVWIVKPIAACIWITKRPFSAVLIRTLVIKLLFWLLLPHLHLTWLLITLFTCD